MNYDLPPPNEAQIRWMERLLQPWNWLTEPVYLSTYNIPKNGPVLFVGNHSLMGGLDVPLLALHLYQEHDIFLRILVDHAHFKLPLLRDFLARLGEVEGTRENALALMRQQQYILVYPGGAREAFKQKGEAYQLLWRNHLGFARLAIAAGCPIVPLATVGAEECYDIVLDREELLQTPLGQIMERFRLRKDLLPPLVKGLGPSFLPKPQRFYFKFGRPIDSGPFAELGEEAGPLALRDQVKLALEKEIAELQEYRKIDPKKEFWRRILPF
ncbi:lysophospholipid acyltransferase family protein [Saprospira grandis]|uniref:lysophospholipid acyltransferase family protein n=1 Tax=Saprospira grandis TaxID=1008 RepID=UPI0022DD3E8F|nr:lysophospholipid acyltransferase family protein [Saprospira grandis]WBM75066.1 acyltransferase family protein [Saprospira grandis]